MEANNLEWRMYGLVPYNISPIQQGIQFAHALQEYNSDVMKNRELRGDNRSDFIKWAHIYKTVIILNGGTTNKDVSITPENPDKHFVGSLNNHDLVLRRKGLKIAKFYEPDLGDQLTAVVFLVDERVFDNKKFPNFKFVFTFPQNVDIFKNSGLTQFDYKEVCKFLKDEGEVFLLGVYKIWVEYLGGEKNLWLREFLKQFRLA